MAENFIPPILSDLQKMVFGPIGLDLKAVSKEPESGEYSAYTFDLGHRKIIFRKAKITPKKIGQFVTMWKRDQNGITQPFHFSDDFDFAIIHVAFENRYGQFVFPKSVLKQHNMISSITTEGKRGFRVYPIWNKAENKQAQKTQNWQLNYFLETNDQTDLEFAKELYG